MDYQVDKWQTHRWERDDGRYYAVSIEQDLLGGWVFRRSWGRVGQSDGRKQETISDSFSEMIDKLNDIKKLQMKRKFIYIK